jgi:hypothetical protein
LTYSIRPELRELAWRFHHQPAAQARNKRRPRQRSGLAHQVL